MWLIAGYVSLVFGVSAAKLTLTKPVYLVVCVFGDELQIARSRPSNGRRRLGS